MRVVLRDPSPLIAQAARDHLLRHGILAAVIGRTEGWAAAVRSYDVMLCFSKQADEASRLLRDAEWRTPAEPSEEGDDEPPDLSRLDPSLAPSCPACGGTLPLDAATTSCPDCAAEVDVPELIAQTHGPEALEPCYDEPPALLDPVSLARLTLLCPRCQYELSGLPRASTCPECGCAYDKDRIVREFLSR